MKIIAFTLLAYCLIVAVGIEKVNSTQKGGALQNWYRAQAIEQPEGNQGSGYGKMRSDGGFQNLLGLYGVPVYLLAPVATAIFVSQSLKEKGAINKIVLLICACVCLAILGRLHWLGVFFAGMGG